MDEMPADGEIHLPDGFVRREFAYLPENTEYCTPKPAGGFNNQ